MEDGRERVSMPRGVRVPRPAPARISFCLRGVTSVPAQSALLPLYTTMQAWALLFLATTTSAALGDQACPSSAPSSVSARVRLRSDILCQYDTETPPQRPMNVTVDIHIRSATVIHRTIEMRVLLDLWWNDPFLTWDPKLYDDIQEIQLVSDEIWTPAELATIATLPWARDEGTLQKEIWPAVCTVASNGTVRCTSAPDLGGACTVSYFYWPHVQAWCASFLGEDTRTNKNVMLHFLEHDHPQPELTSYVPGNDWVITKVQREYLAEDGTAALIHKITLHSQGAVLSTGLLGPAIVLSLVLLGTFLLPPASYTRLGLCCCSIFGTVLASSLFFEALPEYDGPDSVVATFYSGLLLLSTVATIMTLLLNIVIPLKRKPPVAPRWLYSFQSWLVSSMTGKIWLKILFMAPPTTTDNMAGLDNEEGNQENLQHPGISQLNEKAASPNYGPHKIWDFFVSFMNRCMFYTYLLSCLILCLHLGHSMAIYQGFNIDELW